VSVDYKEEGAERKTKDLGVLADKTEEHIHQVGKKTGVVRRQSQGAGATSEKG
jgi:hypothetical protein